MRGRSQLGYVNEGTESAVFRGGFELAFARPGIREGHSRDVGEVALVGHLYRA